MMRQAKLSLFLIGAGLLAIGLLVLSLILIRMTDWESPREKSWEMICYANDGVGVLFEGAVRDLRPLEGAWRATSIETGEQLILNATCIARQPKDPN